VLRRDSRHGGDAAAVLCRGPPWWCCCRGRAAAVAVLRRGLPWRRCCSGCAVPWPAVAVLRCGRQWPCCAVACSGGAALCPVESALPTVAVLRRGVQWRSCCSGGCSAEVAALKGCLFRVLLRVLMLERMTSARLIINKHPVWFLFMSYLLLLRMQAESGWNDDWFLGV
jgi:hypothetical protein